MLLWPSEDMRCRRCGAALHYGVKEEATGWKVFVMCDQGGGCGRDYRSEWISMSAVDSFDEVYQQAEDVVRSIGVQTRGQ